NIDRFPPNFMFQLTNEEVELMISQNAISSKQHLGGYFPYAFTKHGILMLANVFRSYYYTKQGFDGTLYNNLKTKKP
ncbi:MAG: ORF6N domain-containing protein, partial [Chitinophagales bacterium]